MAKKITLEQLAQMVQRGFEETRKGLQQAATKDDLRNTEQQVSRHIEGLELKISAYASSWSRDFEQIHDWVKDHEQRLKHIESKRGR
jgi:hypothetical protein